MIVQPLTDEGYYAYLDGLIISHADMLWLLIDALLTEPRRRGTMFLGTVTTFSIVLNCPRWFAAELLDYMVRVANGEYT